MVRKTYNHTGLFFQNVVCSRCDIHSIPSSCAEFNDSLPFSGASSIPLCYGLFPATLLTSSCHLFLGLPLNLAPKFIYNTLLGILFSSILCPCPNQSDLQDVTYLLTPWCRVLLEKLTGLQLVKKFPGFHRTRRFTTALSSIRHLSLSWASPIQSIYPHLTSWRSILILSTHLHLGLPSGLQDVTYHKKFHKVY